ncbi:molybdenum transport system permease protein modb [hydrocarbon metagenome]|uniref:Molybdenum transport system permease protein modb n=1 Tax=hydrocarbon metagenome TaxID=938273 RepID=A0A0W8FE71_9ZZZZ
MIPWSKGIGEFGAGLMLAGATRMKTETLPLSLFLNMSTGKLEYAIAAATILIMISVVSLYAFERYGGATHVY